MNTNEVTAHCESCGEPDPAVYDSYTACCNELVCTGSPRRWALTDNGSFDFDRKTVREVGACCAATAEVAAKQLGLFVNFRI